MTQDQLVQIVGIQLDRLSRRLADSGCRLEASEDAKGWLAEAGYDPVYGARPLKRAIQRGLQDPLALRLLAGDFRRGETIRVERGAEGLGFPPVAEGQG